MFKFFEKLVGGKSDNQKEEPTEKAKREERLREHLKGVGPEEHETDYITRTFEDEQQLSEDIGDESGEDIKKVIADEEERRQQKIKKEVEALRKGLEKVDLPPIED